MRKGRWGVQRNVLLCVHASNDAVHIAPRLPSPLNVLRLPFKYTGKNIRTHSFSFTAVARTQSRYAIVHSFGVYCFHSRARASHSLCFLRYVFFARCFVSRNLKSDSNVRIKLKMCTLAVLVLMSTGFGDVERGKQATWKCLFSIFYDDNDETSLACNLCIEIRTSSP